MPVCKPYFRDENVKCSLSSSYAFWRALFLSSVLTRLCPREDTALSSVMIRPCLRDDKPLSSGERVKGFPKSQEKLCRGAVKVVGVILKSDDTDVWWCNLKGVSPSLFCHTPSALRARPPILRGQSGWSVSFIAAAVEIGLSTSTPPPACSSCAASRREVGRQG